MFRIWALGHPQITDIIQLKVQERYRFFPERRDLLAREMASVTTGLGGFALRLSFATKAELG